MKSYITKLSLVLLLTAHSQAAIDILIINPDFETDGVIDGAFSNTPGAIPTGWTSSGGTSGAYFGYLNPLNDTYSGTTGSPGTTGTMDGPNAFYFGSLESGQGIEQTLSSTFSTDTDYTLTVALGKRLGDINSADLEVQLFAGSTMFFSDSVSNSTTAGTFADVSFTYNADPADIGLAGETLKLVLLEKHVTPTALIFELDIDNIRLTSVPEPSTFAFMLGTTGLVICLLRRKLK